MARLADDAIYRGARMQPLHIVVALMPAAPAMQGAPGVSGRAEVLGQRGARHTAGSCSNGTTYGCGPCCNSLPVIIRNGAHRSELSMAGMCARCHSACAWLKPSEPNAPGGALAGFHAPQVQKRKGSNWRQKELGYNTKDTRTVLTTEDLTIALEEVGPAPGVCCPCILPRSACAFSFPEAFLWQFLFLRDGFLSGSHAIESSDLSSAVLGVLAAVLSSPCIGTNCTGALAAGAHLLRGAVRSQSGRPRILCRLQQAVAGSSPRSLDRRLRVC